jgi:hypothetical protein
MFTLGGGMFDSSTQDNSQAFSTGNQFTDTTNSNTLTPVFPELEEHYDDPMPTTSQSASDNMQSQDNNQSFQNNDLVAIKQDALQKLAPLISQLDQSPEEKFRTMLMMIQASDDRSLLSPAYEEAQKITDEKIRAQALLDIVNEINYFTQPKSHN